MDELPRCADLPAARRRWRTGSSRAAAQLTVRLSDWPPLSPLADWRFIRRQLRAACDLQRITCAAVGHLLPAAYRLAGGSFLRLVGSD